MVEVLQQLPKGGLVFKTKGADWKGNRVSLVGALQQLPVGWNAVRD